MLFCCGICEQEQVEEELMLRQAKCLNYCHGMGKTHFKCLCSIQEKA